MKPSLANVPFPSDHLERQALGNPVRYETLGHGDKLLVHLEPFGVAKVVSPDEQAGIAPSLLDSPPRVIQPAPSRLLLLFVLLRLSRADRLALSHSAASIERNAPLLLVTEIKRQLSMMVEPGPGKVLTSFRIESQLGFSEAEAAAALPMMLHVANHLFPLGA